MNKMIKKESCEICGGIAHIEEFDHLPLGARKAERVVKIGENKYIIKYCTNQDLKAKQLHRQDIMEREGEAMKDYYLHKFRKHSSEFSI